MSDSTSVSVRSSQETLPVTPHHKRDLRHFVLSCFENVHLHKDRKAPDYNSFKAAFRTEPVSISRLAHPEPLKDVTEAIGNTPLIAINRWARSCGLKCNVLAKVEMLSAGGSVKDRIGKKMVEDAEREGKLRPGDIVIEATSGNTGIALSLMCAVKGYHMVVVMPEKMSQEKENTLKALGAQVIRTRSSASYWEEDSHICTAYKLMDEINSRSEKTGRRAVCMDQYLCGSNPEAHCLYTAEEIFQQTHGKVDMVVMSAGTGGTLTGVSKGLKDRIPGVKIVSPDPEGSIMHKDTWSPSEIKPYEIEGIGYDFHPSVFQRQAADEWVTVGDAAAFTQARALIRWEGILCGGSCGAALEAVAQAAKNLDESKTVVVLLPDSIRNYLTKFASDDWMAVRGFLPITDHEDYPTIFGTEADKLQEGLQVVLNSLEDYDPKEASDKAYICKHSDGAAEVYWSLHEKSEKFRLFIEDAEGRLLGTFHSTDLEKLILQKRLGKRTFKELTLPLNVFLAKKSLDWAELVIAMRALESEGRTRSPCAIVLPEDSSVSDCELISSRKGGLAGWRTRGPYKIVEQSDLIKAVHP